MQTTKVSNKMAYANSTDPDQTVPEQGLHCLPFTKLFKQQLYTKQNLGQIDRIKCSKFKDIYYIVQNKVFKILGHLQYLQNE